MNITAATTSARFAVVEYLEECAQERERVEIIACAFVEINEREREAERAARYAAIKAKRNAEGINSLTYEEFSFMYDYEEEQWRNSEEYAKTVAWLHTPEAKEDINYSDIYKDVYGFRPRW